MSLVTREVIVRYAPIGYDHRLMTLKKRAFKFLIYIVYVALICEGMTRLAWAIPPVARLMPTTEEDW